MDIYVGNLPYTTDEDSLRDAFSEYGSVDRVNIIIDRETGRSKGFAFVAMADFKEAQAAIKALDNADFGGRPIRVNQAKPREERSGGGGGGGYGGGGGGGGGGFRERRPRGGGGGGY